MSQGQFSHNQPNQKTKHINRRDPHQNRPDPHRAIRHMVGGWSWTLWAGSCVKIAADQNLCENCRSSFFNFWAGGNFFKKNTVYIYICVVRFMWVLLLDNQVEANYSSNIFIPMRAVYNGPQNYLISSCLKVHLSQWIPLNTKPAIICVTLMWSYLVPSGP